MKNKMSKENVKVWVYNPKTGSLVFIPKQFTISAKCKECGQEFTVEDGNTVKLKETMASHYETAHLY